MDVQVRDSVADHRRVHMLSPGSFTQSPTGTRAPPADSPSLGVSKVRQTRRVPPRFHKQVA